MLQAFPPPLVSFPLAKRQFEDPAAFTRHEPLRPFLPSTALLAALWHGRDDNPAPNPPSTLYLPIGHPTRRKRSLSYGSNPWTTSDITVKRLRMDVSAPSSAPPQSPDLSPSPSSRLSPSSLELPAPSIPLPPASLTRTSTQQDLFTWPPLEEVGLDPEDEAVMPEQEDAGETEKEEEVKRLDEVRVLRGALC
ncbi:hypothetical protein NBRC10513_004631 [Rhodotorula toruloides]